jgi:alpha-tubulin suppressor-like RCC1 family protein
VLRARADRAPRFARPSHAAQGHTVVVAASGEAYAFGANKCGQLGTGSVKNKPKEDDVALSPVKCAVTGAVAVAAGAEFTAWVTKDGDLLTAGLPQYGQARTHARARTRKLTWLCAADTHLRLH